MNTFKYLTHFGVSQGSFWCQKGQILDISQGMYIFCIGMFITLETCINLIILAYNGKKNTVSEKKIEKKRDNNLKIRPEVFKNEPKLVKIGQN